MPDAVQESLTQKLLKKGFLLYGLTALTAPLGYLIRVLISRDLSVADFGILYGIMSLIGLVWTYNDLGFSESLNYFLPKKFIKKDWAGVTRLASYAMAIQFSSSVVLGVALWFLAEPLALWFFKAPEAATPIRIYILFLFGHGLYQVPYVIFNALQDVKANKGIEFVRLATTLGLCFWLGSAQLGSLEGYSWVWISGVFVATLFTWALAFARLRFVFDRRGFSWDPAEFFPVMRYAVWSVLAYNVGTILSQLDAIFIILLLGNVANGYYSNYLSIMALPFFVIGPAITFLFPVISDLYAKGELSKIRFLKSLGYRHLAVLGVFCGAFFVACGPSLARLMFGEKFLPSGEVTAWSGPFLLFNFLLQLNFQLLAGTGRARVRMAVLLAGVALNLATLPLFLAGIPFLGVPAIGLPGAALASGIGWVLIFALSHRATLQFHGGFDWKSFLSNVLAAGAVAAVLRHVVSSYPLASSAVTFALVLAGAAALALAWAAVNLKDLRAAIAEVRKMRVAKS